MQIYHYCTDIHQKFYDLKIAEVYLKAIIKFLKNFKKNV